MGQHRVARPGVYDGRGVARNTCHTSTPIAFALGGCDFLNPKKVPITFRVMLPQKSQVFNRGNHTECDWYYKVTASGRTTRLILACHTCGL